MEPEIDDGSPVGGVALAVGAGSVVLVLLQLPAAAIGVGWIPAVLAMGAAPVAVLLGSLSLITEESARGRRSAKRGMGLGLTAILAEIGFAIVVLTVAGAELEGLILP